MSRRLGLLLGTAIALAVGVSMPVAHAKDGNNGSEASKGGKGKSDNAGKNNKAGKNAKKSKGVNKGKKGSNNGADLVEADSEAAAAGRDRRDRQKAQATNIAAKQTLADKIAQRNADL